MMTFTPNVERPCRDGLQRLYFFPNGYGASVVQHSGSYGGPEGMWELAVLAGESQASYSLTYDTPITDDVLGWLSDSDVNGLLSQIADLPQRYGYADESHAAMDNYTTL